MTFEATLPRGKRITVTVDDRGVSLSNIFIPWSNIHLIEVETPGTVVLTTIAASGDHVSVTLSDATMAVTEAALARRV